MSVAFVQKVGFLNSVSSTALTVVIPVTVTTKVGNTVVAWFRQQRGNYHAITIADSKSNTWNIDADYLNDAVTWFGPVCVCSSVLTTALVNSDTITLTISGSAAFRSAGGAEFSGLASVAGKTVIDQNTYATNSGSTASPTTSTVGQAQELALTFCGVGAGSVTLTTADPLSGGAWTDIAIPTSSFLDAAYQVGPSSLTAFQSTWTSTGTNITGGIITYKAPLLPKQNDFAQAGNLYMPAAVKRASFY